MIYRFYSYSEKEQINDDENINIPVVNLGYPIFANNEEMSFVFEDEIKDDNRNFRFS